MILADKITDLRKKEGWSQEELAERLGVSRQSVSKWESAQSVPDMNRIIEMSKLFGVSTDYLLLDSLGPDAAAAGGEGSEGAGAYGGGGSYGAGPAYDDVLDCSSVSMEEANAFLAHRNRSSGRVALGVMLCILSPCLLITLSGAYETGRTTLSETQASGIGLFVLILMIAAAVALFVTTGLHGGRFEYLEKDRIETAYGVDGMVRERRERFRGEHSALLTGGIVLCVAAAAVLFAAMTFFGDNEFAMTLAVAFMLAVIAVGVFMIVKSGIIWDGFSILLEEGEYTPQEKLESRRMGPFAGVYWSAATVIFLGWSFITGAWHRTWIVWPIAGVAFGLFSAVVKMLRKRG